MDDAFATLGLPRRLVLEGDMIDSAWRELGKALHPDIDAGDAERAAAVNQAREILRAPSRRLRHWLDLHGAPHERQTAIEPDLMDLFTEIGPALAETDTVLKKRAVAASALARALLAEPELASQRRLQHLLARLTRAKADTVARFPDCEAAAEDRDFTTAHIAAGRLGFLEKWERQVQERLVALIAA